MMTETQPSGELAPIRLFQSNRSHNGFILCIFIYMYVYIYMCIYIYVYIYLCVYMYIYIYKIMFDILYRIMFGEMADKECFSFMVML